MNVRLHALLAFLVVTVSSPLAWAGAPGPPPNCTTDEECVEMGYNACASSGMCEATGGDPFECSSDADCAPGETCMQLSSFSECQPDAPAPESDATGGDATGASESAQDAGGGNGGCQGGQTTHGLLVVLAGLGLFVTRRRAAMR